MSLLLDWVLAPLAQIVGGFLGDAVPKSIGATLSVHPTVAYRRRAVSLGLKPRHGFAILVAIWLAVCVLIIAVIAHLVAKG